MVAKKKTEFSESTNPEVTAQAIAAGDLALLDEVLEALAGENRRMRHVASLALHKLALIDPSPLRTHGAALVDALDRPEPQTRWQVLETLELMIPLDARIVDKAIQGLGSALHDEDSAKVRLAAFKVLCAYGATTATRSTKVWPLIDECIPAYHGDEGFPAMLTALQRMVSGAAAEEVKWSAAERMRFDAENAKGMLARQARAIVAAAPTKKPKGVK